MRRPGIALAAFMALAGCDEPMVPHGNGGPRLDAAQMVVLDSGLTLDGGGFPDAAESCEPPEKRCGTRCVNVLGDPRHCGDCERECTGGAFCSEGECKRACSGGLMPCGTACVDFESSREHCGGCDRPCAADRVCRGGSCVCATGSIECHGDCVDPATNTGHCGICDRACAQDEICSMSSCTCRGGTRETECNDGDDEDCDELIDCMDPDCTGQTRGCMGRCGMGTQSCEAAGDWGACMGGNGTAEICGDGIDQDCAGGDLRVPDAWEVNDTCDRCAWITMTIDPMTTIRPSFDSVDDAVDCFKFNGQDDTNFGFPESIDLRLEMIPAGHDYDVFLYKSRGDCDSGTPLASGTNGDNADEMLHWQESFGGNDTSIYYIRVVRFRGHSCTAQYALTVDGLN